MLLLMSQNLEQVPYWQATAQHLYSSLPVTVGSPAVWVHHRSMHCRSTQARTNTTKARPLHTLLHAGPALQLVTHNNVALPAAAAAAAR
jgi:hypothetical protein